MISKSVDANVNKWLVCRVNLDIFFALYSLFAKL